MFDGERERDSGVLFDGERGREREGGKERETVGYCLTERERERGSEGERERQWGIV